MRTVSFGDAGLQVFRRCAHAVMLALAACLGAAAPQAMAQTYEWIDERGGVNRSDTLPPAGSFRELRVIGESANLSAFERRTLEIINQEARAWHPEPGAYEPPETAGDPFDLSREPVAVADVSSLPENVRDPCLLSWDPQCHEKHAADYHPQLGYAPSILRPAEPPARDASARSAP